MRNLRKLSLLTLMGALLTVCSVAQQPQTPAARDAKPAAAASASAQDFRAGGKSFVLPSPIAEMQELGPDYRNVMDVLVPNSNRLVAAYLLSDDIPDLQAGKQKQHTKLALVETIRQAEFYDLDEANFQVVVTSTQAAMGQMAEGGMKDQVEEITKKIKAANPNAADIQMDKPLMLGTFFSKPNAQGFGMMMPVTVNNKTTNNICGALILRVKDRLLAAYIYTPYKDESSVRWVRETSEKWADAILQANL